MAAPVPATARPVRLWRRVSLREQMVWGFVLPVLVMLLASLYVVSSLDDMTRAAHASEESSEASALRHALVARVVDAETGLRGFLLSSDPAFLQPYSRAPAEIGRIVRRLEITDATEPDHLRTLRQATALVRRWREEFAEPLVRLRRATPAGIDEHLAHLEAQLDAADAAGRQRAVGVARERIGRALGPAADTPRARRLLGVLERLDRDGADAAAARTALQPLADAYRADERRIVEVIRSRRGKRIVDEIRGLLQFSLLEEQREQRAASDAVDASAERARWIALIAPGVALILGLSVVLLLLVDANRAIHAIGRAAEGVASGDLDKRVRVLRNDELGQLGRAFNRMAGELRDRRDHAQALDRLQALLLSSNSLPELYEVVAQACRALFPGTSGAIYCIAASRNLAERVAAWDWPDEANGRVLDPQDCRAIRTGQPYYVSAGRLEVPCRHLQELGVPFGRSGCLPLSAQGEVLGILQLTRFNEARSPIPPSLQALAVAVAEQLAMTMANLQLREQLRQQSIRDPLTGLCNRRFLEETLDRELARSLRSGQPLAVVAIDVDHFKRFNDTHGHEAGDLVLVELARLLRASVRGNDVACRYGGEEFMLLMPDCPAEAALQRAEALRAQVEELRLRFGASPPEAVTISVGIATAPAHGDHAAQVVRHADGALYAAKAQGRNRVVVYRAA